MMLPMGLSIQLTLLIDTTMSSRKQLSKANALGLISLESKLFAGGISSDLLSRDTRMWSL
jgi:hypothetical protein